MEIKTNVYKTGTKTHASICVWVLTHLNVKLRHAYEGVDDVCEDAVGGRGV